MRKRQRFNECKLKICTGCAAIIPCFIYRYISVVIKPVLANKAFFVEWKIGLAMSFNLTGENGADNEIPLTDYNGSTVYRHMAGLAQDIEPALRHMLESSLLYLNTWMNRQANNH